MKESLFDVRRDAKKVIGVMLALFAINLVAYFGFVMPRVREASALVEEKSSFASDMNRTGRRVEALELARDKIVAQEQRLNEFYVETLGTKRTKMVEIEREIDSICRQFGIDPLEVSYDTKEVSAGRVERFISRLPLRGGYKDLRKFLERVEQSKNFLVIDSVSLQGTRDSGSGLQLSVEVATYFDAPWLLDGLPRRRGRRAGRQT